MRFVTSPASSSTQAAARLAATKRAAQTVTASLLVTSTKAALAKAQAQYSSAKAQYDAALAAASVLAENATVLEVIAADSTRVLLLALRPSGSPASDVSPIDVFFGGAAEDQVLNKLSTVDRLNTLNSDLDALAKQADGDNARAQAARKVADSASDVAATVPLADARDELANAQRAADKASSSLAALRVATAAAAESFELLVPVPADDGRLSGQAWAAPASGPITDTFGPRPSQPAGAGPFHYAVDIGTGCNAWEYAAAAGTVVSAGPFSGLGNRVVIDHGSGITTTYGHIVDGGIAVNIGQQVTTGEAIALSGSTGVSTGCHLHFEVAIDGVRTDPLPFLAARGVTVG